jgi:predicted solute-binding protein
MKRDQLLHKAEELINGDRAKEYGDAKKNFEDIARLWSVVLGIEVTAQQMALCMIMVKAARLMKTDHEDSWIDIAGYAALGGEK